MSSRTFRSVSLLLALWIGISEPRAVSAHAGPPFPIVSEHTAGAYRISVWTDPDATDDGSAGGQFWVILARADGRGAVPRETKVQVSVTPRDRNGATVSASAAPEDGSVARWFAALVMDHEGSYAVRTSIDGPLGLAAVDADVDATYDLRPPPATLAIYLLPFLLVGGLWLKLLLRRRAQGRRDRPHAPTQP